MSEFPVNIYWERELHPRPCLLNYSTTISWPRRCKFFCFRDSKPSKQIGHLNLDLQIFSCCFIEPPTKLLHIVHVFTYLLKDQNCHAPAPNGGWACMIILIWTWASSCSIPCGRQGHHTCPLEPNRGKEHRSESLPQGQGGGSLWHDGRGWWGKSALDIRGISPFWAEVAR